MVQVRLNDRGRDTLARRRAIRADRLAAILARISAEDRAALAAALPAIDALASAQRDVSVYRDGGSLATGSSHLGGPFT